MPKVNKSQFAILGMLSIQPMSGYEIRRHMEDTTNYFWKESDGQLYPTLEKLLGEEKILCQGVRKHGARQSKVYEITQAGHAVLAEWIEDPSSVFLIRSEFLLKVFFGANASIDTTRDRISAYHEERKQRLQMIRNIMSKLDEEKQTNHSLYWKLCYLFGESQLKAAVDWSARALEILDDANN
jgi:PadR family transcriptional regulator, regulatory protein AphA